MKKTIDIIFVLLILLIITGGFIKPLVLESKINYYENRTSYTIPSLNVNSIFNKTFQDKFEKALSDQIPLSNRMKIFQKQLAINTNILYSKILDNAYANMGSGIYLINDYLIYPSSRLDIIENSLSNRATNYNKLANDYNDTEFYLYYIERDTDIEFEGNIKVGAFEYLNSILDESIIRDKFTLDDFEDYKNYYYKTDHHWNYKGAYKGYTDIAKMFNEEPVTYEESICLNLKFSGSKSIMIGGTSIFKDEFCAYKFNLPEHKTYITNQLVETYGDYPSFFDGTNKNISYGAFYGSDSSLISFDYNNPKKDNLLIIGDSFDNPINELIASHFNKTYNIDLRSFQSSLKTQFNLKEFIDNYEINKVIYIGNINYFTMDEFAIYR